MKKATASMFLDKRYKKQNSITFPVRLRVTWMIDGKYIQKYYATDYSFSEAAWKKMRGKDPGDLEKDWDSLQAIEKKARKVIAKLRPFTFESFEKKFKGSDDGTLKGAFQNYVNELKEAGRVGTASSYNSAFVSLNKYKEGALLTDINIEWLNGYQSWMDDQGNTSTTIGIYLRALRAVMNKSEIKEYPFGKNKFSPPQGAGNKRALNEDIIYRIYHYKGEHQKAKDFWIFSYEGAGINLGDVCRLKYSDIDEEQGVVSYYRAKTKRTKKVKTKTKFDYTPEIKRIVKKYGTGGSDDDYIFPVLQKANTPEREKELISQFIHVINNGLKNIAGELKVKPFSSYSSRHSWTTVQIDAGVSIADISRMIHDGNISTTQQYVGSLNVKKMKSISKNLTPWKKQKGGKVVNL